jgi:hypothetical protein
MAKQSTTTTRQAKGPDFIAYVVTKRDGQDKGFWNAIGAAWNNKDGDGLNIHLNALPLTGEIVLRRPKADE